MPIQASGELSSPRTRSPPSYVLQLALSVPPEKYPYLRSQKNESSHWLLLSFRFQVLLSEPALHSSQLLSLPSAEVRPMKVLHLPQFAGVSFQSHPPQYRKKHSNREASLPYLTLNNSSAPDTPGFHLLSLLEQLSFPSLSPWDTSVYHRSRLPKAASFAWAALPVEDRHVRLSHSAAAHKKSHFVSWNRNLYEFLLSMQSRLLF